MNTTYDIIIKRVPNARHSENSVRTMPLLDMVVFMQKIYMVPRTRHIEKNRESIRDATAELQVKIIWSCFINK
jgi:hypothetical protein